MIAVSVPAGLAASIIMNQIYHRARGLFYLVTVSPLLTPGVIIGISTVIFWKDVMGVTDFTKAVFYKGIILAILGQSSFVVGLLPADLHGAPAPASTARRRRRRSISAPPIRRCSGTSCCRS